MRSVLSPHHAPVVALTVAATTIVPVDRLAHDELNTLGEGDRRRVAVDDLGRHVAHGDAEREALYRPAVPLDRAYRLANARELLASDRLSIDEVAFLVGYSELRSFTRALKRWTGETPARFRRRR